MNHEKAFLRKVGVSVFLMYLSVAVPLSAIPLYVKHHLNESDVLAGLSVGAVFLATLLTRSIAGYHSDVHGGKKASSVGVIFYAAGNVTCLISVLLFPSVAYYGLILGRVIIGIGESYAILGFNTWGISRLGAQFTGRVTGMVGLAMYGALMAGAPFGLYLYNRLGFEAVLGVSTLLPFVPWIIMKSYSDPSGGKTTRLRLLPSPGKVLLPGSVVGLQGIGFAAISAFITLYFIEKEWGYQVYGLTAFGIGFVLMRLFFSHLPDRIGGYRLAFFSLCIEAAGQYTLFTADGIFIALTGALLTGLGCSLIMPSMGVEAVRSVPPSEKGRALGGISSFQDLSYGLTGPLAGYLVAPYGYASTYLVGLCAAGVGIVILLPKVMVRRGVPVAR